MPVKQHTGQYILCLLSHLPKTLYVPAAAAAVPGSSFTSNKNSMGGPITMSAGPLKPGTSEGTGAFLGFDAIEQVQQQH
jgi:hypothetical protein